MATLEQALDFRALAVRLGLRRPQVSANSSFQELLDWLMRTVHADWTSFDGACRLDSPLHEHRLYELAMQNRQAPEVMVAGMITLLALIILRFGRRELWLRDEWSISRMRDNGRLSVHGFPSDLKRRLEPNSPTVFEVARDLYADYVILQHQLVATGKLPENTFRFQREGDRIRFYQFQNSLGFADSRQATTTRKAAPASSRPQSRLDDSLWRSWCCRQRVL